jgi:hypothetical protein
VDGLPSLHGDKDERMNAGFGLPGAARRVADHTRALVRLELQLATAEVKRKLTELGAGVGVLVTAAALALLAITFAFAAIAAALALVLPVWAAMLVMFGSLLLVACILARVGIILLRRGAPPVPEQALEEARLTTEALRNGR